MLGDLAVIASMASVAMVLVWCWHRWRTWLRKQAGLRRTRADNDSKKGITGQKDNQSSISSEDFYG